MSKDILLLAAIGAGVYIVLNKQAQARNVQVQQGAGTTYLNPGNIPASGIKTSVNGDMWAKLMGRGFTGLLEGLRSSDGKPIMGSDQASIFYNQIQAGDVVDLPGLVSGGYEIGDGMMSWDDLGGVLA